MKTNKPRLHLLIVLIVNLITTSLFAQQIYKTDCNSSNPWTEMKAQVDLTGITAQASWEAVGTIDVANTSNASGGLLLSVVRGTSNDAWSATLSSGLLSVTNNETNLAKLTLSFDHSVSVIRPVFVQIESFDANRTRTGGLETQVEPAAIDFFIRSAVDLNTMVPFGGGSFSPKDPYIQISFKLKSVPSFVLSSSAHQLRIDNIAYASPAYYVSPAGSNAFDGRTEKKALQTIQMALDKAQPGDIICVMDGTYEGGGGSVANFPRKGSPASWIVLKNYPGHKPKLTTTIGWSIVNIGKGSSTNRWTSETLAYLEVRGLWVQGKANQTLVDEGKQWLMNNPAAITLPSEGKWNSNGIGANGYYMTNCPHHLRFADNLIEYVPAGGVGTLESDWVQMENNVVRNCCWTNIYGSSNIGTLGAANFDSSVDNYRILIRNNISSGARSNFKCNVDGNYRITDGNGIIIDVNQNTSNRPTELYIGRTLVQNNVCFNNGGSGIHAVRADHVDIIGNTAYMNSASPELQYSPMYTYSSKDVKFINNIMVAPIANTSVGEIAEPVNQLKGPNNQVTFMNNLYFGGNIAPTMGSGDKLGDPKFINASIDPSVADFHLTSSSPAIASGATSEWMYNPRMDLDGKERRVGGKFPDIGAYCYSETKQQKITFNPLPNKAPTDADFTLTGSVSSGLEIIYSSTNQEVAKIIAGQIHIIGIGITIITATQPGNSVYAAASSICQSLVVTKDLETDPGQIPGSNLIYNSTFDTDLLGWGGYREGSTSTVNELIAKEGYSGNAAKITVTNGGTVNWYIQFSYPVAIEAQRKYSIQFKASADAPRIITFAFQENVGSKRTWFTNPNINITTIPTVYGPFYFNCTTTDNTDIFKFLIGNSNVSVFFDDVIITDVTNPTITSQLLAEMKPVLKIFPNPVSDKLTFETINYSGGKIRISLFDINGRLVLEKYQQNISDLKMTHEMNVSHLNQGVYLLKVNYANEQKTGMVVIKR